MFMFLIDNIFVMLGGRVFQQEVAFQWVPTVILLSRLYLYETSQENWKEASLIL
jgi:hypothetical protein